MSVDRAATGQCVQVVFSTKQTNNIMFSCSGLMQDYNPNPIQPPLLPKKALFTEAVLWTHITPKYSKSTQGTKGRKSYCQVKHGLSDAQTHPCHADECSLTFGLCKMCLHFSSAYFQYVSTSSYHMNCNTTRSFFHPLLTRSVTFLHTRVTIPIGFVCAVMHRQPCSPFCETLFTHSSFVAIPQCFLTSLTWKEGNKLW